MAWRASLLISLGTASFRSCFPVRDLVGWEIFDLERGKNIGEKRMVGIRLEGIYMSEGRDETGLVWTAMPKIRAAVPHSSRAEAALLSGDRFSEDDGWAIRCQEDVRVFVDLDVKENVPSIWPFTFQTLNNPEISSEPLSRSWAHITCLEGDLLNADTSSSFGPGIEWEAILQVHKSHIVTRELNKMATRLSSAEKAISDSCSTLPSSCVPQFNVGRPLCLCGRHLSRGRGNDSWYILSNRPTAPRILQIPHPHSSITTAHQKSVVIEWWTNTPYMPNGQGLCLKDRIWADHRDLQYFHYIISCDKYVIGVGWMDDGQRISDIKIKSHHLLCVQSPQIIVARLQKSGH